MPSPSPRWRIEAFDAIDSTMTPARRRVAAGCTDGTVIQATEQLGGRGRHGRVWASPPGNLYMTVIVRPDLAPRRAGEASLVAGVAVAEALTGLGVSAVGLKWPNDVLAEGGKIAGILPEALIEDGALRAVLLGIGVNIASKPDLPDRATSRLERFEGQVDQVRDGILGALDQWIGEWGRPDGFAAVRDRWLRLGPNPEAEVSVKLPDRVLAGRYRGVDADGALLLAIDGRQQRVVAGEVIG